ncbi:glycosyltransferase [Bacteroides sp.]|uniref:glycosyltransferase family 2 protein n=1 Tax=Bacteroides sp. TaxID=29523 RepID=UPI00260520A4|nr:glycosyltransferase [Bacteroides sp.]MDD3040491.1 glycosyltransferase [Bacteroides sp.]
MYKIGFVILHYMAYDMTVKCVNNIKQLLSYEQYSIVVIDNGSSNDSGNQLEIIYRNDEKVKVIRSDQNLGFARGNNLGFSYAKKQMQCDFICMMNNDVLLIQDDTCQRMIRSYENTMYAVMGPRIYDSIKNVYPVCAPIQKIWVYQIHRMIIKIELLLSCMGVNTEKIIKITRKILGFDKMNHQNKRENMADVMQENVILHGCCWFFSPQYIKMYDGINDETFLYREEELLYIRVRKNEWQIIYNPQIEVQHLEKIATKTVNANNKQRREFIYRNQIKSLKVLIMEMKKLRKGGKLYE